MALALALALTSVFGFSESITSGEENDCQRKKKAVYDKLDRKITADELHFASIRGGDIAGTHSIGYESEFDSIELKHTAKTRLGFAKGALIAARWLMSKKEGFFTEKDLMDYLLLP